jgi:hypothetical protein
VFFFVPVLLLTARHFRLSRLRVVPSAGLAFLGAQGDVWGAQKAMFAVALVHWRYDPVVARALRASLRIGRGNSPLGEEALQKMLQNPPRALGTLTTAATA